MASLVWRRHCMQPAAGSGNRLPSVSSLSFMPEGLPTFLSETELLLNLLERNALGLWNHRLHPNELQHHHPGKKREHITWRQSRNHLGEKSRERGGEDPVREAAQSLALRPMAVGKNLGNENPDHR